MRYSTSKNSLMKTLLHFSILFALLFINGCVNKIEQENNSKYMHNMALHDISVTYINVGYADAILIKIDDLAYMIDTGSKSSVPALYGALALSDIEKINGVFLTHTHSDHIGGMKALADKYEVEMVYSSQLSENKKNGDNKIDNLVKKLGLPQSKLSAGDMIELVPGIFFEVIGPLKLNEQNDNDNSLVLRLYVNDKIFLFTGDMQFSEEKTLMEEGIDLSADVLKVGNHGNPDATSKEFANLVSPEIAIISTDKSDDADSANKSVKSNLKDARIFITENFIRGIIIRPRGVRDIQVSELKPKYSNADIEILEIDKTAQNITIINNGEKVDLSGYYIFSEKGSEIFTFNEGSTLESGQKLNVICSKREGEFIWRDKKVWNTKKEDFGVLYDCYGNELSRKK